MSEECFKIDMGCNCPPAPPDKPRPFCFSVVNDSTTADAATIDFTTNAAGVITGFIITNTGFGYRIAPTIVIGGSGTLATATCTINGSGAITSVTITNGGSGYGASVTVPSTITPTANNLITFDQLRSYSPTFTYSPLQRLTFSPPAGGGVTLASAKIQVRLTYTVKTNGVTDFTGIFTVNGVPQTTTITVDDTNATYTTVTHYSGTLSLNYADNISYKITSTESKLYDISAVIGTFLVKYI